MGLVIYYVDRAINNIFELSFRVFIFGMKYLYLSLALATKLFTFKTNFVYGVQKVFQSRTPKVRRS